MKIAILTQPLRKNYGGILQAYALQTILMMRGHNVLVVNREYNNNLTKVGWILRIGAFIKALIHVVFLRKKEYVLVNPLKPYFHTRWKGYVVLPFVKKYINQSIEIRGSKTLKRYFTRHSFDCYVVGSDQVWRPCYSPCITDYFLKEVPSKVNTLKIAYAASFGTDKWEFSSVDTIECATLAAKFDAISVREESGVFLCQNYFKVSPDHLLDPTMLLDVQHYIDLFKSANVSCSPGNAFCYVLDKNRNVDKIIQNLQLSGFKPFTIQLEAIPEKKDSRPVQKSVEEWLRAFYDAEFVITDSFHACVFAILFQKPFAVWNNKERGSARFESLLSQFEMQERLISSFDEFDMKKPMLLSALNKMNLDNLLRIWRAKSDVFFQKVGL